MDCREYTRRVPHISLRLKQGLAGWIVYLPLFSFLFIHRRKKGLAFALGIGALMGFVSLLFLALLKLRTPLGLVSFG